MSEGSGNPENGPGSSDATDTERKQREETEVLLLEYEVLSEEARHRNARNQKAFYLFVVFAGVMIQIVFPMLSPPEGNELHIAVILFLGGIVFSTITAWSQIRAGSMRGAAERIREIESELHDRYPTTFKASRTNLYSGIFSEGKYVSVDAIDEDPVPQNGYLIWFFYVPSDASNRACVPILSHAGHLIDQIPLDLVMNSSTVDIGILLTLISWPPPSIEIS